ncbi:MAG: hypothetical protein VB055_10455 [Oscillospiraceae bacterium]|nr:hypothetical protein [Oscillospiraceae bacterium]
MLKALMKVQFAGIAYWLSGASRAGRKRQSKKGTYAALMLLVFLSLAFMFYNWFSAIAAPFYEAGLGFLYFALFLLIDFAMMLLGSLFTAKAQLFEAKDNELLLALPLPPQAVLFSRISMLISINLLFELTVAIPVAVCWLLAAPVTAVGVLSFVLTCLLLPLTVTAVAALLGWLISLATRRVRNKTLLTTVFSLAFLALYFVYYTKLMRGMSDLAVTGAALAGPLRGVWPLYIMSAAISDGSAVNMLLSAAMMLVPFLLAWWILSVTFLKTVTTHHAAAKVQYREKREKAGSADGALYRRELSRLLGSAPYIMNSGLGVFAMIAAAVALLLKWAALQSVFISLHLPNGLLGALLTIGLCFASSMTTLSAPSVSLEGKNIWIAQSLPVDTRQILDAKIRLHLSLAIPAVLLPILVSLFLLRPALPDAALLLAAPLLFNWLLALLGLAANLKFPNLDWNTETAAVKNGLSVLICIFGGWLIAAVPAVLLFTVSGLSPRLCLLAFCLLLLLFCALLRAWLQKTGCRLYQAL